MDNSRTLQTAAEEELSDFVCPDCNNKEWRFDRKSDHWEVKCKNCDTYLVSVKPEIQRTSTRSSIATQQTPNGLKFFRLFWFLFYPILLYQYIRAARIFRPAILRDETTQIQERSLEVNEKFQRGVQLIKESAEEGPEGLPTTAVAAEAASTLLKHTSMAVTEQDAKEIALQNLPLLWWLHPVRLYNQLIKYAPHDDRVQEIDADDPIQVARTIQSFREESSYGKQPNHVD